MNSNLDLQDPKAIDPGKITLISMTQNVVNTQGIILALFKIGVCLYTAALVTLVKPFILKDQIESVLSCKHFIQTSKQERLANLLSSLFIYLSIFLYRMLRYFGRIHAREIATEELLRVHTISHVRNYYPMDEEDVIKKEETIKPLKVTSIAAILNPAPSSPTKPAFNTRSSSQSPMVMRGVGGGVVIQADQDHIKRQHRRFSSEAAAVDASQSNPQPIAPPGLVCKMTCGELGIAVDTTFHPLHSSLSARVAAGALLALVEPIVQGQMRNGFALVRPPGKKKPP
jgi:hypothetical protein